MFVLFFHKSPASLGIHPPQAVCDSQTFQTKTRFYNKHLLYNTGNSDEQTSCDSLDGRGVWGEWVHVCVWPSHFAVHLKLSQHSQSAILQYTIFKNLMDF